MRMCVNVGYVDLDVDIKMEDFDTDVLIGELEERGFEVLDKDDTRLSAPEFESQEIRALIDLLDSVSPDVGSELYFIREKLARS